MRELLFRLIILGLMLGTEGCTTQKTEQKLADLGLTPGKSFFSFDTAQVSEILIAKNDPQTGDRWTSRFQKTDLSERDLPVWKIVAAPEGRALQDNRADAAFIQHLLDTLRSFQFTGPAPPGSLASHGLEPPRYALRWKAGNTEYELRIGQPEALDHADSPTAFHAPPLPGIFWGKGALIKMLDHLSRFDITRQTYWLTWTSDEIDQIESSLNQFAQREGDDWTNKKHVKLKGNFSFFLDQITHARILEFVDRPEEEKSLLATFQKLPSLGMKFTSRTGATLTFKMVRYQQKIWGTLSTRPGVFRLYEKTYENVQNMMSQW